MLNTLLAILMSLSLVTQVVAPRTVCTVCLLAESISPGSSCCSSESRISGSPVEQAPVKSADCCRPKCCQQETTPVDQASFCSTQDTPCVCSHMPPATALLAAPAVTKPLPEHLSELPQAMVAGSELQLTAITDAVPAGVVNRTKPYAHRPLYLLDCRFII